MVGKPKTCISRYIGGLGQGSFLGCWNGVPCWFLVVVTMSFKERMTVNTIYFVIC
jgi:hypothetical protein